MALKPERDVEVTDMRHVAASGAAGAEGGDMLVKGTGGSGALLGGNNSRPTVTRAANPSGTNPIGLCLATSILASTFDETLYHRNFHQYVQKVGEPIELMKKGYVVTNRYVGSPTANSPAYLSSSGCYTPTIHATGGLVATPLVGEFESAPDEDGYVSIRIELPRT